MPRVRRRIHPFHILAVKAIRQTGFFILMIKLDQFSTFLESFRARDLVRAGRNLPKPLSFQSGKL